MKLRRIAVLALAAVLLVCAFASCASAPKTKVKITFIGNDGDIVIDPYEATLKGEAPTVMDAVKAVKDAYATAEDFGQITLSDDESSVKDVDSYKENLTINADGQIAFWMFYVNGEEPKGDANAVVVKEGDNIVFEFVYKTVNE